tara:strand:- start:505 stop:636 length:132 start_codon:yes stop_codon:yes gene_type:complete
MFAKKPIKYEMINLSECIGCIYSFVIFGEASAIFKYDSPSAPP